MRATVATRSSNVMGRCASARRNVSPCGLRWSTVAIARGLPRRPGRYAALVSDPGRRGKPRRGAPSRPLTVVVASRNRRDTLLGSVARHLALPERPSVFVVDDASTDGTAAALRRAHPEVTVIELDRSRAAAARNAGLVAAATPYVALTDDDAWWEPGALTAAIELLDRHPRLAVVNAHILVGPDDRDDPLCAEMATSPLPPIEGLPGHTLLSFIACAAVVRREAILAVGGFSARLGIGGEEELVGWDLAAAGWEMAYVPGVVAHHRPPCRGRPRPERRILLTRNALWLPWLRRPARAAAVRTVRELRRCPPDLVSARAVVQAIAGLPGILRERRVSPPHVEAMRRLLEDQQLALGVTRVRGLIGVLSGRGRLTSLAQRGGRRDVREVGERLREVAERLAGVGSYSSENSPRCWPSRPPRRRPPAPGQAALAREALGQPERAGEERALAAGQPVAVARVAADQPAVVELLAIASAVRTMRSSSQSTNPTTGSSSTAASSSSAPKACTNMPRSASQPRLDRPPRGPRRARCASGSARSRSRRLRPAASRGRARPSTAPWSGRSGAARPRHSQMPRSGSRQRSAAAVDEVDAGSATRRRRASGRARASARPGRRARRRRRAAAGRRRRCRPAPGREPR